MRYSFICCMISQIHGTPSSSAASIQHCLKYHGSYFFGAFGGAGLYIEFSYCHPIQRFISLIFTRSTALLSGINAQNPKTKSQ